MNWYDRFAKMQEKVTRERMTGFLAELGIDPKEVAEIRIYPDRLILTRYLFHEDGRMMLDHIGPRTAETYFHIQD